MEKGGGGASTRIHTHQKNKQEFVYNKAQRLMFDQSSPNGILLFREASKVLVAYGTRVLQHPYRTDVYKVRLGL